MVEASLPHISDLKKKMLILNERLVDEFPGFQRPLAVEGWSVLVTANRVEVMALMNSVVFALRAAQTWIADC